MRRLIAPLALSALLVGQVAYAQVSRPNPSVTPQNDTHIYGVPVMPSPVPTCAANKNGFFADGNGCIYACAGTSRTLVAAGASCSFPTGARTATPTPTATATPTVTATPTATPTPTVTATP